MKLNKDDRAFERVKGQIAVLLEDFPEPELRIEVDRDPRQGGKGEVPRTPVGFGPNLGAYRTDLMFGSVRCATCSREFTRIGPGHYRAACLCRRIEKE